MTSDRPSLSSRAVPDLARFTAPAVVALAAVALIVGYLRLKTQSIWLDEAYSISFAGASWPEFVAAIGKADGPIAAYYLLLRAWFAIVHPSVAAGRALSLCFAVATIPVTYLLGRQLFSRNVGLIAATLLACNATLWLHADDMRVYSVALFLSTLCLLFFARFALAKRVNPGDAFACALANAALLCFHFVIGLTTILGEVASLPMARRDRDTKRGLAVMIGLSTLAVLVVGVALSHLGTTQSAWIPHLSPRRIWAALSELGGRITAFATILIAIAIALIDGRRRQDRSVFIVASWAAAPIVAVGIVSIARPLFLERYLLSAFTPLLLLAAVGIVHTKPRVLAALLLAAIVGTELYGVRLDFKTPRENWALESRRIVSDAKPGDVVDVFPAYATVALVTQLHLQHAWLPSKVTLLPATYADQWTRGVGAPESLPSKYLTGKNTIWVIVRNAALWPPASGFESLLEGSNAYRLCASDKSLELLVLKYMKTCETGA